ncbi:hypothetical protein [Streptomyces melanogenes]|uniref:hypothetical protein n=1 Tax=Streptomyces melanogenes TaxID=67326 RepID=UPI0037AC63D2
MPVPQSTVHRRDQTTGALLTPTGQTALETIPLPRATLEWCLRDGVRTIDSDVTSVTTCDCGVLGTVAEARWGRQDLEEFGRPVGRSVLRASDLAFGERDLERPGGLHGPVRHAWTRWSG